MKTIAITEPAEIEAIIRKCPYCMVGITDQEGNPYVVPMNFAYRDGVIYLHSGPEGSKVEMVERWQKNILVSASPSAKDTSWCICTGRWHAATA